jgi:outer membrane protein assembly factor BamE (lipoprotein component of BamABCDE complex)
MRSLLIALFALLAQGALAQDDVTYRLMKLEQDVRNLERQVQTLTRQIDELKQQSARAGDRSALGTPSVTAPAAISSTAWLEAARWDRVRPGMSELEVIGILGPPSSMRQEGDTRVLLYAMEIGSANFLGGSVEFRDQAVSEIHKPVLK